MKIAIDQETGTLTLTSQAAREAFTLGVIFAKARFAASYSVASENGEGQKQISIPLNTLLEILEA